MTLLPIFAATVTPDQSSAMGRVVANVNSDAASRLEVSVRAPRDSKNVTFSVDGQRRWVDHSPKWQFGPRGYLHAANIQPGRHLIATEAALRGGGVKRASRVVYLTPRVGAIPSRWRLGGITRSSTPPSPPAPTPAPLNEVGFENGFAGWSMAGVGDAQPTIATDLARTGAKSAKVILTGNQDRSELILGGSGDGSSSGIVWFSEGQERYYAFSFLVKSMQYGRPGAHNLIMQFKSDGEGSPNFGLHLWDYQGKRGLWSHGAAAGGDRYLAPIAHDQWNDVVIHFKASRTGQGFYETFLNGQLIDSRQNVSMIRTDRTNAYLKTGLYRNGGQIPGTSELRFDSAKLGTSMAQVATS